MTALVITSEIALALVIAGLLWREQRRDTAVTAERAAWARERSELLNRIKPETAQVIVHPGTAVAPAAVPYDDDKAFWESRPHLHTMVEDVLENGIAA